MSTDFQTTSENEKHTMILRERRVNIGQDIKSKKRTETKENLVIQNKKLASEKCLPPVSKELKMDKKVRSPLKLLKSEQSISGSKSRLNTLSTKQFRITASGKAVFINENCNILFTEETLEPAKFFPSSCVYKDFSKEHLLSLITSDLLLSIGKIDEALKLYCLCLLSVTTDKTLAKCCHLGLMQKGKVSFKFSELTSVLLNWGLESPSSQLPQQLLNCSSAQAHFTHSLPQEHNLNYYLRVLAVSILDLSPNHVVSLLPILVSIALDPIASGILISVTQAIDACFQVLLHKKCQLKTMVKWLKLDSIELDNFVMFCTHVLPKSSYGFELLKYATYWYLSLNVFSLKQNQSKRNITLKCIACLLTDGEAQLNLLEGHKLFQIFILLEAIFIRISLYCDDLQFLDNIISILSRIKLKFRLYCNNTIESLYNCHIIDQLILLCNYRKEQFQPEDV